MRLLFQHLPTIRSTFLTLLFSLPQVLLSGSLSDTQVLATDIICPEGTKPIVFNQVKSNFKTRKITPKIATHCAPISAIGDTVFNDINGNYQQDANEPGIGGVRLYLKDSDGNVIGTTTTDSNGKYSFSDLVEGQYTVTVPHPPHGFTPTLTPPHPINLVGGRNFDDADFGFRPPSNASIGDTVFSDRNGNGIQDNDEPGIPNVVLTLTLPGSDGNTTQTTTTNSNGNYNFNNLPAGDYKVTVTPPADFPQITTGNPQINVSLQAGQSVTSVDFGLRRPTGSIGDFVFNDKNNDSVPNSGDIGLPNVKLTLKNANGQIVDTTTTDSNGNYLFTNVPLGKYTVEVTQPNDFSPTTKTSLSVTLTEAEPDNKNVDFGFAAGNLGASGVSLQLVKRITAVFQTNGQRIQYNNFVDDPNDDNDNQLTPTPLGQYELLTPLTSNNEVEYTIYFHAGQSLKNLNLCDLIPAGTTYVTNSISVTGSGSGADQGRYFSPLTSLEQLPESLVCENRNNLNGTVIVKLGNISTGQSGSVSFRVKID